MKKKRSCPAQEKAILFLRQLIRTYVRQNKMRLPTIHALADLAGVSRLAMGKAVTYLKQEGTIDPRQGKGITITQVDHQRPQTLLAGSDHSANVLVNERSGTKWYRVANQIEKDIITGNYQSDEPLPSHKELSEKYGISLKTLNKALSLLLQRNIIFAKKHNYIPALSHPKQPNSSILLITRGHNQYFLPNIQPYIRSIRRYCDIINSSIKTAIYGYAATRALAGTSNNVIVDMPTTKEIDDSLGVILFLSGLEYLDYHQIIYQVLSRNKPIAILDENGIFTIPKRVVSHRLLRHFAVGYSRQPGRDMGRYLGSLGHRKIAYITYPERWSVNRYDGLVDAIKCSGSQSRVASYISKKKNSIVQRSQYQMIDTMIRWCKEKNDIDYTTFGEAIEDIAFPVAKAISKRMNRERILPLFEKALQDEIYTAWVCANDEIAMEALSFLRTKNIRIPHDISVVGFDDSLDAHLEQLTSYNFNTNGIVHAMINHIVSPRRWHWTSSQKTAIEIEGHVVERLTTRKSFL